MYISGVGTAENFSGIHLNIPNRSVTSGIQSQGFYFLRGSDISIPDSSVVNLFDLLWSFDRLPLDNYLRDGEKFRYRRYSRFLLCQNVLEPLPVKAYFQSEKINSYAGGISRKFESIENSVISHPLFQDLVLLDYSLLPLNQDELGRSWEVGVHQVRIIAEGSALGHPTPEGVHRDGVAFFAVHLLNLRNAVGGVSTIYDQNETPVSSFALTSPFDSQIVDDSKVLHAVTPIAAKSTDSLAVRDVFIIDFEPSRMG